MITDATGGRHADAEPPAVPGVRDRVLDRLSKTCSSIRWSPLTIAGSGRQLQLDVDAAFGQTRLEPIDGLLDHVDDVDWLEVVR